MIVENGKSILENTNYYRNILIKPANIDKYYAVSAIIYFSNNIYKLITRFYKILCFTSSIPLDYIYKGLTSKFSPDIVNIIIDFYLQDDISFHSIREDHGYNTIKFISNINYSNELSKYQTSIEYPIWKNKDNLPIDQLVSFLSNNFQDLLNSGASFDINSLYSIKNHLIDLCNLHKITNKEIAWGIQML